MPPTPLVTLAAAAKAHADYSRAEAAELRALAKHARRRPSAAPATRRADGTVFQRQATVHADAANLFDQIAARLTALVPKAGTPGKVPRGSIEFRVYQGGSHAFNWKALRGGHIIAHATGYDRKRDSVRQVKAIIAAIQTGKVVITQAGKGKR